MATIKKRGDHYLITVSNGRRSDHSQIRVSKTFIPTASSDAAIRKEVEYFAADFERNVKAGKYLSGEKLTFQEFVDIWFEDVAKDNLTTGTFQSYRNMVKRYFTLPLGHLKMSLITPLHIKQIYSKMRDKGLTLETVKRHHVVLNQIMRYAFEMDVIELNPCDKARPPKRTRQERESMEKELHFFNLDQAQKFLHALTLKYPKPRRAHTGTNPKTGEKYAVSNYTPYVGIPYQFQVYFTIAIYSGFRRGEMIPLTWNDIDFIRKTITIKKAVAAVDNGVMVKCPKTVSSSRTIRLPDVCFDILHKWKKEQMELPMKFGTVWKGYRGKEFDKNYIFIQEDTGKMMHISTPYQRFKSIIASYNALQENEADKLPDITLHDLRHTAASLLIAHGTDIETVSHRLGHARASVTLDIYGHFLDDMDETASDTLERIFKKA